MPVCLQLYRSTCLIPFTSLSPALLPIHSYMYLAVTLSRLDDFENACAAYDKAITMAGSPGEPVFHLNYGELRSRSALTRMLPLP